MITRAPHRPTTEKFLRDILAKSGPRRVRLGKSIVIKGPLVIPSWVQFDPDLSYLVRGSDTARVQIDGQVDGGRQPCFYGWNPGDIYGTFGGGPVYPEKWYSADGDMAHSINCAIQTNLRAKNGSVGTVVDLGVGVYPVSAPLSLAGVHSELGGAGAGRTIIRTTNKWQSPVWESSNAWPDVVGGNHSAVIWIGSKKPETNSSFFSVVRGLSIECDNASASNPTRRVSGIAGMWVEECSVIDHVSILGASGCGIGIPQHMWQGDFQPATVNGLRMSSVWIGGPKHRDSYGVYLTSWATNWSLRDSTIDLRIGKEASVKYTYPLCCVHAPGDGLIEQLHCEGAVVGVLVPGTNGINSVKISGLKTNHMMDQVAGQVYFDDGKHLTGPAPVNGNLGYGTGVLITGKKDNVVCENIVSLGQTAFNVRDVPFGVAVSTYGRGQFPLHPYGGVIRYSRSDVFRRNPGGTQSEEYDPARPLTDRKYFELIA